MSNTPFSKQRAYTGLAVLPAPDSRSIRTFSVTGNERWMKFNLRALAVTVGCLCFLSRPIHAAGKYLQVDDPPSTGTNQLQIVVTYTILLPDDVPQFPRLLLHQAA